MAERQAFITLKDHKDNFENKPTCRLINAVKSEIGRISKQILENINTTVRHKTGLNQWKSSASVINWYSDISNKNQHTFAVFDIENFYPSITEKLLTDSINLSCTHENHYSSTTTRHGSRKTPTPLTWQWAATTARKFAKCWPVHPKRPM